jgi:hypothetical protein
MAEHLHACEGCGRVFDFLAGEPSPLWLVEVEDIYGRWSEWLCIGCVSDLAASIVHDSTMVGVRVANFDVPRSA